MKFKIIGLNLGLALLGFAIGRMGHILGGQLDGLHHWIYGMIILIIGLFFYKKKCGCLMFSFGLGLFVSDFKDFMDLKIYGADDVEIIKFWRLD